MLCKTVKNKVREVDTEAPTQSWETERERCQRVPDKAALWSSTSSKHVYMGLDRYRPRYYMHTPRTPPAHKHTSAQPPLALPSFSSLSTGQLIVNIASSCSFVFSRVWKQLWIINLMGYFVKELIYLTGYEINTHLS